MKITGVEINNLLSIGHAAFSLDNQGLVLVQGKNKDNTSADSNGAGKSSLIEAVPWCLFGDTAKGDAGDTIIKRGAKAASVTTRLREGDDEFVISRERKVGKGKVRLEWTNHRLSPPETQDLTLGTDKLTQAKINSIIGCDKEIFTASVCLGQEQMPDFPNMTDKALKEIIERAAGLTIIEGAYQVAKDGLTAAKRQHESAESAAASVKRQIAELQAEIPNVEGECARFENSRAVRITALRDEIDTLSGGVVIPLASMQASLADRQAKQDRSRDQLKKLRLIHAARADLRLKLHTARQKVESIEASIKRTVALSDKISEQIAEVNRKIASPCEACGKSVAQPALEAIRQSYERDLEMNKSIHATLVDEEHEKRLEVTNIEGKMARIPVKLDELIEAAEDAVSKLGDAVGFIQRDIAEAEGRDKLIEEKMRTLQEFESRANPFIATYAAIQSKIAMREAELAQFNKALEEVAAKLAEAQEVVEIFSPKGVRGHLMDQVTPFLNTQTATYLDALSDETLKAVWSSTTKNSKGEMAEKFAITVNHPEGEGFSLLSGGEKRKVRLACALAVQDLVGSRATKPFDLFIADEIDQALDTAGLERLLVVLSEKAKDKGTVLLISHNNLKDWVPNVWTMTKEKSESKLSQS